MKIAYIGVTGNVGRRIADEALRRGHSVTGIARDTTKIEARPNLTLKSGDAGDPDSLAQLIAKHDVVISSVAVRLADPHKLIEAARKSGVKRLCDRRRREQSRGRARRQARYRYASLQGAP
jgi:putative NADH-flavin reductase